MADSQGFPFALLIITQCIFSALYSFMTKQLATLFVTEAQFNHPTFLTFIAFVAQSLCYPIFLIFRKKNFNEIQQENEKQEVKKNPSIFLFLPLVSIDVISMLIFMILVGMKNQKVSIIAIVRASGVIMTSLLSVILLKVKLFKIHYIGIFFSIFGVITIALYTGLVEATLSLIEVVMIAYIFFIAPLYIVIEEKVLKNYNVTPFESVGIQGLWAILLTIIASIVMTFIPCFDGFTCYDGSMNSLSLLQRQLFQSEWKERRIVVGYLILSMFSFIFVNSLGSTITKRSNAIHRNVAKMITPIIIWALSCISGKEQLAFPILLGYFFVLLGCLIFNGVITNLFDFICSKCVKNYYNTSEKSSSEKNQELQSKEFQKISTKQIDSQNQSPNINMDDQTSISSDNSKKETTSSINNRQNQSATSFTPAEFAGI